MLNRFEQFILNITEIDLYWHRLASAEMKRYGLKGNYAIYFTRLHEHPEGITSTALAALCGKDKADVSRDMTLLEKAGFVERQHGYRAPITLTAQGRILTDQIIQKAELAVRCIGQGLTDQEREIFYRTLDSITANLQAISESGLPEA